MGPRVGYYYTQVEASEDVAEQLLVDRYGRVDLAGPLRFRQQSFGDARFAFDRLKLSNSVIAAVETRELTVGSSSLGFGWSTRSGEGHLGTAPAAFRPGEPFVTTGGAGAHLTNVTFAELPLAELHRAVYGASRPLRFTSPHPVSREAGRRWRALIAVLAETDLVSDTVRDAAYRALVLSVFSTFPLIDQAARERTRRARSVRFADAVDYMRQEARHGRGVPEAAAAVGVPVAELERLFLAFAPEGQSPSRYLRQIRLEGARNELASSTPTGTSVAEVAHRWGFLQSGRFVRLFTDSFHRMPHQVLADDPA